MSMQIFKTALLGMSALLVCAGCSSQPDNSQLAEVEAAQSRDAAAAGRVYCALGGAEDFQRNCTMDRIASADGTILVLGRADAGYRRFRLIATGYGVEAADGAEPATITMVNDGMIEVTVAQDRYRLPATPRPQTPATPPPE